MTIEYLSIDEYDEMVVELDNISGKLQNMAKRLRKTGHEAEATNIHRSTWGISLATIDLEYHSGYLESGKYPKNYLNRKESVITFV